MPAEVASSSDCLLLAGSALGGQQVERAGIIASFILNAAMIPGWPPPRPFEPTPEAILRKLSPKGAALDDAGIIDLLRERGIAASLLERVRERLASLAGSRRFRILMGLAVLLSCVEDLIELLDEELDRLAGRGEDAGEADLGGRRALTA